MTTIRSRSFPVVSWVSALLVAVAAVAAPAAAQQGPQSEVAEIRAHIEQLRRYGELSAAQIQFWVQMADDDDYMLLPGSPWPIPLRRSDALVLAGQFATTNQLLDRIREAQAQVVMDTWDQMSRQLKADLRRGLLADLKRRAEDARVQILQWNARLAQLGARPSPPLAEPPRIPPQTGWAYEQAVQDSLNVPRGRTGLKGKPEADAGGGSVTMTLDGGRDCLEDWKLSWTFTPSLKLVKLGQTVTVNLKSQLVGGQPCTGQGATVTLTAGTPFERSIPVPQAQVQARAIAQPEARAAASSAAGQSTVGVGAAVIRVDENPASFPAYALIRIYSYVPGFQHVTVYVLRGEGN